MAETLGERIASMRHAAGLSQSQLAERAGVSTGTLRNWEQGIRYPLPAGLAALAKGLGVSPGPLLEGVVFPGKEKPQKPARLRKAKAGDEIQLTPEQEAAAEAAWDERSRKKTPTDKPGPGRPKKASAPPAVEEKPAKKRKGG